MPLLYNIFINFLSLSDFLITKSDSLSCVLLTTTLISAGRAPAIATKIATAGTRARTAPHPRRPARI